MYTFKNAQYCKNPKTNNNISIKVNMMEIVKILSYH